MTTQRIVYTRRDGGLSVVIPAPEFMARFKSEPDALVAVRSRAVPPDASEVKTMDASSLPPNRYFRDAWVLQGAGVGVDLITARGIHMGHIRAARDRELAKMDVATMKAVGRGDQTEIARVETKKQALRDIPQAFDLDEATTAQELAMLWPDIITRK